MKKNPEDPLPIAIEPEAVEPPPRSRTRVLGRRLKSKTPELVRAASAWLRLFRDDQPPSFGASGAAAAALMDRMHDIVTVLTEALFYREDSSAQKWLVSKLLWQDVRLIENLSNSLAEIAHIQVTSDHLHAGAHARVLDALATFHLGVADAGLSSENDQIRQLAQRSSARILEFFRRPDVTGLMADSGRSSSLSFWHRRQNLLDNCWQALVDHPSQMAPEDLRVMRDLSLSALEARCLPYMAGRASKPSTNDQPKARAQWLAMAALDDNWLLLGVVAAAAKIISTSKTGWVTKLSGATVLIGHVDMADALPVLRPEQAAELLDADPGFSGVPGWLEAVQRHQLSLVATPSKTPRSRSL